MRRTTIAMIDGRPCVLSSAFAIYIIISPLWVIIFLFAIRKTRARCKLQRALRSKKEEAWSRRGPTNCHSRGQLLMISYLLNGKSIQSIGNHSCHYARFLVFVVCCSGNSIILFLDNVYTTLSKSWSVHHCSR